MSVALTSSVFEDFYLETAGTVVLVVLLAAMMLTAVGVNVVPRIVHKWEISYSTRDITYGAVCLAMSFALSFAKIFSMPQGGSVTPAALAPLFIYCYYFGFRKGMVVSTTYMLLQFVQGAYVVSPWSAFFDYMLPCFSVCIVGLFSYKPQKYAAFVKKNRTAASGAKGRFKYWLYTVGGHWGIFAGAGIHMIIRYLSSALSGMLFFGEWTPSEYGPVVWGFLYNTVLLVDSLVALAATVMLMSSRTFNLYMSAAFNDKAALKAAYETSMGGENADGAPEALAATDVNDAWADDGTMGGGAANADGSEQPEEREQAK